MWVVGRHGFLCDALGEGGLRLYPLLPESTFFTFLITCHVVPVT